MRLIDANELKRKILFERDKIPFTLPCATYELGVDKPNHHGNSMRGGIRKALRCMEQCKTIDAVEVVRCKDCKHWEDGYLGYCTKIHSAMEYDAFCSNGERKDNA